MERPASWGSSRCRARLDARGHGEEKGRGYGDEQSSVTLNGAKGLGAHERCVAFRASQGPKVNVLRTKDWDPGCSRSSWNPIASPATTSYIRGASTTR